MDLPSPLPRRLNLGCGWDHRDGYLNVDCYERHQPDLIADISNLPMLPSGYFEEVLAKDVLEHFERTRTDTILAEWARLLSPDGHLVLEVPSLLHLAGLVLEQAKSADMAAAYIHMMFGTQAYVGDYHFTSFTPATLQQHLVKVGLAARGPVELIHGWCFRLTAVRYPASAEWPKVPLLERLETAEAEYRAICASRSWRLLSPARAIVDWLRNTQIGWPNTRYSSEVSNQHSPPPRVPLLGPDASK
jgi:SAM-dependent methyltransferase